LATHENLGNWSDPKTMFNVSIGSPRKKSYSFAKSKLTPFTKYESQKKINIKNFVVVKKALREACASLNVVSTRKNGLGFILKLADPSRSYKINVDTYKCTCSECLNCNCAYFLEHAICKHVYICDREKTELPGLVKKRTFSTRNKKGRPRNASRALQRD
jgi:hypothetical protein